jgi:hypothetical protein
MEISVADATASLSGSTTFIERPFYIPNPAPHIGAGKFPQDLPADKHHADKSSWKEKHLPQYFSKNLSDLFCSA